MKSTNDTNLIDFRKNKKLSNFTRLYLLTNLITIPFLIFLGVLNMVVRIGLPLTANVIAGPAVAGLIMGSAISFMVNFYIKKINTIEQERRNVLIDSQREVIYTMGEIVESRSKETGSHVKRVAEYSRLLAHLQGLSKNDSELLKNASPLHDIGKVGIPDSILLKPAELTREEFEVMKTHTTIGYKILRSSDREILRAAAIVAHQHHENWDGSGYPHGLRGRSIHLFGRITAIVDVFDALSHDRIYKKAWQLEQILEFMMANRGTKFDPELLGLFSTNLNQFLTIRKQYPPE